MRLSVDKSDRGYRPDASSGRWRVLFNRAEVSLMVTADEELGRLVRYRTDDAGRLVLDPATGEPIRDTYLGDVRIIDTEPPRRRSGWLG